MAESASHVTPVCRVSRQIRERVCIELDDVVSLQVLTGPIGVATQITLASVDSDVVHHKKDVFVQYVHAYVDQLVAVGELYPSPTPGGKTRSIELALLLLRAQRDGCKWVV